MTVAEDIRTGDLFKPHTKWTFDDIFDGTELHLDIETYSSVDLSKATVYKYCEVEDWQILICSWAVGRGEVHVAYGHDQIREIPGLFDPNVIKIAHNSDFERVNFSRLKGLPVGQYIDPAEYVDTMALASCWGLPRSLKGFTQALGGEQKDQAGGRLINLFSKPNRRGGRTLPEEKPADWQAYVDYNQQDVVSMRDAAYRLHRGFPTEQERICNIEHGRIVDYGMRMDVPLARLGKLCFEANKTADLGRLKELTGLANPNSGPQMKSWLASQGITTDSLDKEHVAKLLDRENLPADVREALEIKTRVSAAAASKFDVAIKATNRDGRLRGTLNYGKANTMRWAGATFSPQNMPRAHFDDDKEQEEAIAKLHKRIRIPTADLNKLIRPLIIGPLTVADYSAIEARLTSWVAGEEGPIRTFEDGGDIYVATAEAMGGEAAGMTRQKGKTTVLACGYGGGAGAMLKMGGATLFPKGTPEEAMRPELQALVNKWRETHPCTVQLWDTLMQCFIYGGSWRSPLMPNAEIAYEIDKRTGTRYVWLPSGRPIVYRDCKYETVRTKYRSRRAWTCLSVDSRGGRDVMSPMKVVENVVQALGRDLLAHAIHNVAQAGIPIITHVHDEIVTEGVDTGSIDRLVSLMCDAPSWAEGLPLAAAGYTTDRYRKD